MKKILLLVLLSSLVFLMTGCGFSEISNMKEQQEEIEKQVQETIDKAQNMQEEIKEEIENDRLEEFTNYDQVIECNHKDGSYMKYYYVNYKTVRFERLFKYSSVDMAESTRDRLISEEGRNNVREIGTDTFLISDSSDPMWYVHNLSQNDVYRKYENDWMEAGWICSTKDKK